MGDFWSILDNLWSFCGLLGFGALLFVSGAIGVWGGVRSDRRTVPPLISKLSRKRMLAQFILWRALTPESSDEECERLLRQTATLERYEATVSAWAGMLGGVALVGFAFATRGVIAPPSNDEFLLYLSSLFSNLFILKQSGALLGYRTGSLRIRRVEGNQPDGIVRTLGDYVAPWVWMVPLIPPAFILLVCYLNVIFEKQTIDRFPIAISALTGAIMVITAAFALFSARVRINTLNALTGTDALTTQRANDSIKASAIGSEMFVLWSLCWPAWIGFMFVWNEYFILQPGVLLDTLIVVFGIGSIGLLVTPVFAHTAITRGTTGRIRPQAPQARMATSSQ